MAEVKLKKKVTLRKKEDVATFTFTGKLKVKLMWECKTDQDLCLFFKKKDGNVGGVFSDGYRGKKSDLGSLDAFPFMLHLGDVKEPGSGNESQEQINIASLDEIDQAFICILDYNSAVEEKDVTFANENARAEIQSDSGDYLEVIADSSDDGPVFYVCSIKNNEGNYALKNESRVMDLSTAFEQIPGFSLICQ